MSKGVDANCLIESGKFITLKQTTLMCECSKDVFSINMINIYRMCQSVKYRNEDRRKKSHLELRGIDPRTSHMLSERSTI